MGQEKSFFLSLSVPLTASSTIPATVFPYFCQVSSLHFFFKIIYSFVHSFIKYLQHKRKLCIISLLYVKSVCSEYISFKFWRYIWQFQKHFFKSSNFVVPGQVWLKHIAIHKEFAPNSAEVLGELSETTLIPVPFVRQSPLFNWTVLCF